MTSRGSGASALVGAVLLSFMTSLGATAQAHETSSFDTDHESAALSNEVLLFLGDTRRGGVNEWTVGVDFTRSLSSVWGLSLFLDYARADFEREFIAGLGSYVAPFPFARGLHLFAGAGYERLRADHHHDGHWTGENLLMGRFGGLWNVHLDGDHHWVLVPQAFWDVTRGPDATVFGVGVGYHF